MVVEYSLCLKLIKSIQIDWHSTSQPSQGMQDRLCTKASIKDVHESRRLRLQQFLGKVCYQQAWTTSLSNSDFPCLLSSSAVLSCQEVPSWLSLLSQSKAKKSTITWCSKSPCRLSSNLGSLLLYCLDSLDRADTPCSFGQLLYSQSENKPHEEQYSAHLIPQGL